jgi:hypothetical protein
MSQRVKNVGEEMLVNLQVKVNLNSFSNYDGFKEGQVEQAIEEFKSEIARELKNKLADHYQMQEFLYSVDFVNYEIDS